MRNSWIIWPALPALMLAGCARDEGVEPMPPGGGEASAEVRDAGGRLLAIARAVDEPGRLRVRVEAEGLAPGAYGAHIHAVGRCEPPDGAIRADAEGVERESPGGRGSCNRRAAEGPGACNPRPSR